MHVTPVGLSRAGELTMPQKTLCYVGQKRPHLPLVLENGDNDHLRTYVCNVDEPTEGLTQALSIVHPISATSSAGKRPNPLNLPKQ